MPNPFYGFQPYYKRILPATRRLTVEVGEAGGAHGVRIKDVVEGRRCGDNAAHDPHGHDEDQDCSLPQWHLSG